MSFSTATVPPSAVSEVAWATAHVAAMTTQGLARRLDQTLASPTVWQSNLTRTQIIFDPPYQHVALQGCGTAANLPDHNNLNCSIAIEPLPVSITDGHPHTIRIDYTPFSCDGDCSPNLFVYLDGVSEPILQASVDIAAKLSLGEGTSAYVGFTAATRGASEAHDILNWTFSSSQTQTVTHQPTPFNFNGGPDEGGYSFTAKLSSGPSVDVKVTPILKSQSECNALVQASFPNAQCFIQHRRNRGSVGCDVRSHLP